MSKSAIQKILLLLVVFAVFFACKKNEDPENPYDSVNYNTDTTTTQNPDPNSIVGLHKNIFFPKCARSGCHDGTFEPDYRTVQSSYSTLVYQSTIKKSVNGVDSFNLRVIPGDTTKSLLRERLRTPTADYMPSNGARLPEADIQHILNWIQNGARDQQGNVAIAPNLPPYITSYDGIPAFVAFQTLLPAPAGRLDSIRVNNVFYNPFVVPYDTFYMAFFVADDSTAAADLKVNQLRMSLDKDDFSSSVKVNAFFFIGFWILQVPNVFPHNSLVYFRYYVNDGSHAKDTEFPTNQSPFFYKSYCSFYVQ